ncbi:hypothetical protein [Pseudomonas putida]|uniref:hypothetical protein n=1 Tax=Pseudomonas putida TaxID=303 RepID=UPI00106F10F0|nr:hypothetical protein [Pseudomonas putida]
MIYTLELEQTTFEVPNIHPLPEDVRTSNAADYRVDKNTGEIYGKYIKCLSKPTLKLVEAGQHRLPVPVVIQRDLTCSTYANPKVPSDLDGSTTAASGIDASSASTGTRRGPKPKVRINRYADIIRQAVKQRTHWIENAVMAAVYITVGSSNGTLNIRPTYVRHVITMPIISTEKITLNSIFRNHDFEPVSDRYARYLASAGRVAVDHIERYLEQHPDELTGIQARLSLEDTWGDEFDLDENEYSVEPI